MRRRQAGRPGPGRHVVRGLSARLLLAGAAGVAAAAAFPPYGLWWLVPPAVAALSLATRPGQGFRVGLVFGFAFMGVLLPWLTVIGTDAWLGLSLLEALFYGLLGWGLHRTSRLALWPIWHACLWIAVEALRGVVPWGGFNWGRLAFAMIDGTVAPAVTYVGASGVTFLVALSGSLLAWTVSRGAHRAAVVAAVGSLALLCVPTALPTWQPPDAPTTARIAVVQGNVPGEGMEAFAERRAVLDNHVEATLELADRVARGEVEQPDLVLWPENSTDIDPFRDPTVMRDISRAVDAIGVPTLVGAMIGGPGPIDVENQGIVWVPEVGPTTAYSKMHPVPFGEYIPMREFLAQYIERLDQIPRDMVPGDTIGRLDLGSTAIGDVICFEVIYDGLIRDVVDAGAELLVVQTNNATYMGTGQVEQQYAIARLRALETRRVVAIAATNGISAVVDPNGEAIERAPTRTQQVMLQTVPLLTELTPAVRFGALVEACLAGLGLLALAWSLARSRRRSRAEPIEGGSAPAEQPAGVLPTRGSA
ncbi:MAG TPA: apolipoprotein N-acyltransferase [Nocardioidaceae bacterium]|nr:apolipoprotein N-acyltransferase [Nocardioidaceae bacterium]